MNLPEHLQIVRIRKMPARAGISWMIRVWDGRVYQDFHVNATNLTDATAAVRERILVGKTFLRGETVLVDEMPAIAAEFDLKRSKLIVPDGRFQRVSYLDLKRRQALLVKRR